MIIIRTKHDTATAYLYYYTEDIIKEAEKKGYNLSKIEGNNITEKEVRKRINSKKDNFIFFNGHGTDKSLYDNKKIEFISLKSADLFNGMIAYTRSCNSLNMLGKEAVKKGCKAFIGYKNFFWIARNHKRECQPLKDEVARPILECSNVVVKELIKRKSVKESLNKSHKIAEEKILELIYSKEPLASASLQALVSNDSSLDYEGDDSCTISLN